MVLLFWTAAAVAVLALVLLALRRSSNKQPGYWLSRNLATFDTREVFGGNFIVNIFKPKSASEVDTLLYQKIKYEMKLPCAGVHLFSSPHVIVCDLDLAKKIFVKDADHFLARLRDVMKNSDPFFAKMLFFMEGEAWRELRGKMSPTFTTGKIKKMFHILDTSSKKLADYLSIDVTKKDVGQEVEVVEMWGRYTMDVIASVAFGIDAHTFDEEDPIFLKMGKKFSIGLGFKMILKFILIIYAPVLAKGLGLSFIDKDMQTFFSNVINNAIKHRETTGYRRNDFLQLMLDARNGQLKDEEEGAGTTPPAKALKIELSDEIIVAQSVSFILAGFDTTQTLIVFAIYELALNPEFQEKLCQELVASWDKHDGKFTYEVVNELEYLDKITNEALRKYPPVIRLERRTMHDYQIPDTNSIIPKGAQIVIPTFPIHRDPEYFPNPEKFDPERFSQENKNARNPYAFQPFGHGPRNCIGMRFALTNAKMAIATLVHNFKFEPSAKTLIPMEFENSNFLKPKGGLYLKVTKRV